MAQLIFNFDKQSDVEIKGYKLRLTSYACPEQYDVFDKDGALAGYLRLRHGYFCADYPDCGGETVYESNPAGDGMFEDLERLTELTKAIAALDAVHKQRTQK